jgi:aminoglycoside phosphotransferase (APT) family kinase protein
MPPRGRDHGAVLARALEKFISTQLGTPVRVLDVRRLTGGSSHETWSFDVARNEAPDTILGYVLRRAFDRSEAQSLSTEFALLQRLSALGLAVARPEWCAHAILDVPFMIMERVAGVDLRKHLAVSDGIDRPALGRALVKQQVAIHEVGLDTVQEVLPVSSNAIRDALAHWITLLDLDNRERGRPLLSSAVHWLQMNAPAPTRLSLVHGDFKTNNLILGENGRITILDWEMAHIGDPLEDVAWTLLWTTPDDLVGGLLSRVDYLKAYCDISGSAIVTDALFYWEVFARIKLAAIFLNGARATPERAEVRPFHALLGRALPFIEVDLARMLPRCFGASAQR